MRFMLQRKNFESVGSDESAPPATPRTPMVVWIHDGPVCVTVVDEPRPPHDTACRCGGCHASAVADLAARYLP